MELHDIVIVGGGLAGLRAAIEAAESNKNVSIAIVSKVYPIRSHSVCAEGGTAAALRENDSPELHAWDTVKGADFLADQDAVELFCKLAPKEILRLDNWGCPWNRTEDGKIAQRPFGGHSVPRTVFAADRVGLHETHTLYERTLMYENITYYNEYFTTNLVVEDDCVKGLTAIDLRTGELVLFNAKAIILATGGAGRIYDFTTVSHIVTGDGIAIAYRNGVPLKDMEFFQFFPVGLIPSGIGITEAARGEGGYLRNRFGERFMKKYAPQMMELAPRDIVTRAVATEIREGRGFKGPYGDYVVLDLTHLGEEKINERLPLIREMCIKFANVDPVEAPVPIRPIAHYTMGGIDTNMWCETKINGLFAVGECACISIHGANRLGSNSTTECLVFGAIAGKRAVTFCENKQFKRIPSKVYENEEKRLFDELLGKEGDESVGQIKKEMQTTMDGKVGVFRNEKDLLNALKKIKELKMRFNQIQIVDKGRQFNTDMISAIELSFMLDLAEVITMGALKRTESRGGHFREDYPERDDKNWLRHSLAYYSTDGPTFSYKPVTITKWQPVERKY
jgi:succinate dehydrogenase / fumarate reductase flavoprotein subunit